MSAARSPSPAGIPSRMATRAGPCDSPAVRKRSTSAPQVCRSSQLRDGSSGAAIILDPSRPCQRAVRRGKRSPRSSVRGVAETGGLRLIPTGDLCKVGHFPGGRRSGNTDLATDAPYRQARRLPVRCARNRPDGECRSEAARGPAAHRGGSQDAAHPASVRAWKQWRRHLRPGAAPPQPGDSVRRPPVRPAPRRARQRPRQPQDPHAARRAAARSDRTGRMEGRPRPSRRERSDRGRDSRHRAVEARAGVPRDGHRRRERGARPGAGRRCPERSVGRFLRDPGALPAGGPHGRFRPAEAPSRVPSRRVDVRATARGRHRASGRSGGRRGGRTGSPALR